LNVVICNNLRTPHTRCFTFLLPPPTLATDRTRW